MSGNDVTDDTIQAAPTKGFIISGLVRDIELIPAVADLVDNSLDGARRLRGAGDLTGLWVKLTVNGDRFEVSDNCGGFSVEIAREHAFMFGRTDREDDPGSVGQFGIGMKRALFKMGEAFTVSSVTRNSSFSMSVDVAQWSQDDADWTFEFDQVVEGEAQEEDAIGTSISISPLHAGVAEDFGDGQVVAELREDLAARHSLSISLGLRIEVNGDPLEPTPLVLAQSEQILPISAEFESGEVAVKLSAGVADSDPSKGGWYLFCNGRMILEADQTSDTGWGWRSGGQNIPQFHAQFARFRGFAFLEAENSESLPWNTTKTGVDLDSPLFRQIRRQMVSLSRPVIDFLNDLSSETRAVEDERDAVLQSAVDEAVLADVSRVPNSDEFVRPQFEPPPPEEPTHGTITFARPLEQIAELKELLRVTTNYEVGEAAFDFYYSEHLGEYLDER